MEKRRIHFMYDRKKEPDASFAGSLIGEFRQARLKTATHVISVGGDGLLLRALRQGQGKAVAGVMPPGSNSRGFWTNKNINDAAGLADFLETAPAYTVKPLRAEIRFSDGSETVRYAYNDFSIRPIPQALTKALKKEFGLSAIDLSVQSVLLDLRVTFDGAAQFPPPGMGSGVIFSTPFGSTAMNRNFGGPAIDIRNSAIILTGIGQVTNSSTVNSADAIFDVAIESQHKRPAMMTFDNFAVIQNEKQKPMQSIRISTAHDHATELLLADDPGLRAFAGVMG